MLNMELNPRVVRTINRDWGFCYDPASVVDEGRALPGDDEGDFYGIALPHTWHTHETTGAVHPFMRDPSETDNPYWWHGWGWYRKRVSLDSRHVGRRVFLEFDGVQKYCRVYCNGAFAAEHKGGFASFSVELTEHIRWGAENVLAVAVSARRDDSFGAIPPLTAGNWNTYGGIYRDVLLVLTNPLYIPFQGAAEHEGGTFVATPEVDGGRARVRVTTHIRNSLREDRKVRVSQRVIGPDGRLVTEMQDGIVVPAGEQAACVQESDVVRQPRLWSPEAPNLYRVDTSVRDGDLVVDAWQSPLGFRWFHWDYGEDALHLNGERVRIVGMNRHQEYPWLGDAVPKWVHVMDLEDMRDNLGVNFARWCHYTQDKVVYDWCDRHGILVCEEVPNIKSLPFGREVQRQQVVEMVRRDRNHPCIVMWSMGNETDNAADGAWALAEDASRIIHYRHVRGPDPAGEHTDRNLDMENLLRCTVRGWWTPEAMAEDVAPLPEDHEHGQITGNEVWQHRAACIEGGSIRGRIDRDPVVWLYADHGADREYRHCPLLHLNPKGWVDAYRQKKLIYWLWQAHYCPRLMAHVHEYWWRRPHIGQRRPIVVDSNGEVVELYVGDALIGAQRPGPDRFLSVVFEDVEVRDDVLRAVARRGAETVEHCVPMAGAPVALRLTTSHGTIASDRAGVALITVEAVDADGAAVFGARPPIHWQVDGPATLLTPADCVSEINNREQLDGAMYVTMPFVAPIRSTREPGVVIVTASCPGLRSGQVVIGSRRPAPPHDDGICELSRPDGSLARLRRQQAEALRRGAARRLESPLAHADLCFDKLAPAEVRERLRELIGPENLTADPGGAAELLDRLVALAGAGGGTLLADDFNVHVRRYAEGLGDNRG